MYVRVDGHMQAMPVSPIAAFETPLVFGGACDSLAEAFSVDVCSPLILDAAFTVDFLCIRPTRSSIRKAKREKSSSLAGRRKPQEAGVR